MARTRPLFRHERLALILEQLQESGYVAAAQLSRVLGVSAVTVRADLDALERDGRLLRTHGGAVPLRLAETTLSFAARQGEAVGAKERIGAAAAELVADGEAIVLDASTTAWHVARRLLSRRDLTVLTTGLYVALELLRSPSISVLIPGGPVWREAASVVSDRDATDWQLYGIIGHGSQHDERHAVAWRNLHRGFFGGRGLTVAEGLTDAHREEVDLKRKLVAAVREVNVVVDGSKWGKVAFAACALPEEIRRVITDSSAPPEQVARMRAQGIEVLVV